MDSSLIALVSLNLDKNGFDYYKCDETLNFGISFKNLSAVLRSASDDDSIILKHNNKDVLEIVLESNDEKKHSLFEFKLLDVEKEDLGVPDKDFSAQVKMSSSLFQTTIKDLQNIGDNVTIHVFLKIQ